MIYVSLLFLLFYSLLIGCTLGVFLALDFVSTFGKQVQPYQNTSFNCIKIQYKKFKFIYFILNFLLSCAILCLNLISIQRNIKIQYKKFKFIYFILNFLLSCAILCLNLTKIQRKLNFVQS